jgi:hypothetical protein
VKALVFVWVVSIAAAILVGLRTPSWLNWRLFVFVPLFADFALSGSFAIRFL